MPKIQEFNLPDKEDPNFADKMVSLLRSLFEQGESDIKDFTPISDPEEGTQIGSMWFDSSTEKFKVMTSSGVKILKYE